MLLSNKPSDNIGEEEGTGIAGIGLLGSTIDAALKVGSPLL